MNSKNFRHEDGMTSIISYGLKPRSDRPIFSIISGKAIIAFAAATAALLSTGSIEYQVQKPKAEQIKANDIDYDGMSKEAIYQSLIKADEPFKAIAVLLEDVKTTVYYDSGGRNIGAGYLLTKQIASKGRGMVVAELTSAGIPLQKAMTITDPRSPDRDKIVITKAQAIKLLSINQVEYERAASKWLGQENYDNLDASQQAAVAYLAYNVGATKLSKFTSLKSAIKDEHEGLIEKHLKVNYKDKHGHVIENKRVGTVLQSAFLTPDDAPFVPKKLAQQLAMK